MNNERMLIPGLSALSISESKKFKDGLSTLGALCIEYLASVSQTIPGFYCVLPAIDDCEEDDEYPDDFEPETESQIPEEIVFDESELNLSDDGPQPWVLFLSLQVPNSECIQIAFDLQKKISESDALAKMMIELIFSLINQLSAVAKSGNFDLPVVSSFLQEIVNFLDLILSTDYGNQLPVSWNFFSNIAANQLKLFDSYIEAETYQYAHDILWKISSDTDSQKKFLERCMLESVGFEGVMSKVGAALESMLLLQEEFILKLIARLQLSKNAEGSETLKWVTV